MKISCDMNMKIYPYDWQNCPIKIRTLYLNTEVLVMPLFENMGLVLWSDDVLDGNPMWVLDGQFSKSLTVSAGMEAWFRLRRKSSYYQWVILYPTFVISFGTILAFVLPAESGEKVFLFEKKNLKIY